VLFVVVCFIAGEICCGWLIAVEILRAVCVICCRLFYCWGNMLSFAYCCGNFACGVCYLLSSVLLLGKYLGVRSRGKVRNERMLLV
jgi:uncharacterized membrane protein